MKRRQGFTLIELMIVLGIILILVAIALPAVRLARSQSERATCMANLRQVTQALVSYATDHESMFLDLDASDAQVGLASPSSSDKVIPALLPYLQNPKAFHCPCDPRDNSVSYSPNDILGGSWATFEHPLKRYLQVVNSNLTFAVIEEFDLYPKVQSSSGAFVVEAAPSTEWVDTPASPHGGGTCISFLDGHCEFWVWTDPRTSAFPYGTHLVNADGNPDLPRLQAVLGGK